MIAVRIWLIVSGLLAVGLIIGLYACMGQWFTQEQPPAVIIGQPVITGNCGEVIISVMNMPNEGMASMEVDLDGMAYTTTKISNIVVAGWNG
jgi:hypothetical protein